MNSFAAPTSDRSLAFLAQEVPKPLCALVLDTRTERLLVAHLRKQTDFKSEYLLDPGLAALEERKDEIGVVMALLSRGEPIATIRFIPSGHGLTLTERFWPDLVDNPDILGADSWEVGRLVMASEHRQSDLLTPSLGVALEALLQRKVVKHMHGSCVMRMTRLYRRFGFQIHARRSKEGLDCALVHAPIASAVRAFKLDRYAVEDTPGTYSKSPLLQ